MASSLKRLLTAFAVVIAGVAAIGAVLYFGFGLRLVQQGSGMPWPMFTRAGVDHEAELERHRAAQQAAANSTGDARSQSAAPPRQRTPAPTRSAVRRPPETQPACGDSRRHRNGTGQSPRKWPGRASGRGNRQPAGSAYWTDFRGPLRDGRYRQGPISTAWPSEGLRPIWKQPIGVGFASFVAAEGRIFTIEQRRDREVVASYDADDGARIVDARLAGRLSRSHR